MANPSIILVGPSTFNTSDSAVSAQLTSIASTAGLLEHDGDRNRPHGVVDRFDVPDRYAKYLVCAHDFDLRKG
jgi:hypothetical protein